MSVVCIATAYASNDAVLKTLKQKFSYSNSFEIQFSLDIYWKIREKHDTMKGHALFSTENKFNVTLGSNRWVSDGKILWHYNEKTNQVIIRNLSDIDQNTLPLDILRQFLTYPFTRQENSTAEIASYRWDTPSADSLKSTYQSIMLWVRVKNATITKLFTSDRSGNENTYTITKIKSPAKPAVQSFLFTTPKGADVVEQRN
jgi:outer membrane lipoprotein-sorting protein